LICLRLLWSAFLSIHSPTKQLPFTTYLPLLTLNLLYRHLLKIILEVLLTRHHSQILTAGICHVRVYSSFNWWCSIILVGTGRKSSLLTSHLSFKGGWSLPLIHGEIRLL
jgi:hypothetical protein